ncbi:hypothetical protein D3C81_783710 [compost metagenome]
MTGSHTGQNCTRLLRFADYGFTRCHYCQAAGGSNSKCMHGLTDDVLPQHRPKCCPAVSAAGVGRPARAFQLNIIPLTYRGDLLPKEHSPAVPELREMPELMSCISLSNRHSAHRNPVAGENFYTFLTPQSLNIQSQGICERTIGCNQFR